MKFQLIDQIKEQAADRIVAIKRVSRSEEYLADHFAGFPVLPGVMMIEGVIQTARQLLASRTDDPLVLGEARAMKFGRMVRPGNVLEVEVKLIGELPEGGYDCRAVARVCSESKDLDAADATAVSGRFTMRPAQVSVPT